MDAQTLYSLGFALVTVGTIIILVATVLLIVSRTKTQGRSRGAGVIIIGPIPIIFGTDKESVKKLLLLSLALTIALIALIIVYRLLFK